MSSAPESDPRAFVAGEDAEGTRLDVVLAAHARLSRAAAQKLIAEGSVQVDGEPARKKHLVRAGERVTWEPPPEPVALLQAETVPYSIVYEDDWLLVVDKPAGVVVHPAPGHEHGTLAQGLVAEGARGGTSRAPASCTVWTRTRPASSRGASRRGLPGAGRGHGAADIHRLYLALLVGHLPQDAGTIDAPIGRHLRDRKRMSLHTAAPKRAVTHFEVLGRVPGYTLARVRLETADAPDQGALLGSGLPGGRRRPGCPAPSSGGPGAPVPALGAARVPHPEDGREIACHSPLPTELAAFLEGLGLPPQPRV